MCSEGRSAVDPMMTAFRMASLIAAAIVSFVRNCGLRGFEQSVWVSLLGWWGHRRKTRFSVSRPSCQLGIPSLWLEQQRQLWGRSPKSEGWSSAPPTHTAKVCPVLLNVSGVFFWCSQTLWLLCFLRRESLAFEHVGVVVAFPKKYCLSEALSSLCSVWALRRVWLSWAQVWLSQWVSWAARLGKVFGLVRVGWSGFANAQKKD